MGIAERKEREKLEMKKRILQAAFEMFVQEGYERTSIRNIADKIEYSPATIYLYYKDKDQLLYDVQAMAFGLLMEDFGPIASIPDAFEQLKQLGFTYLQFGFKHPQYYDLMFILAAPMNGYQDTEMWLNGCQAFNMLVSVMQNCIEQKRVRFTDAHMGSLQAWAQVHGLISLYIKQRLDVMDINDEQARQAVFSSWLSYLKLIEA